MEIGHRKRSRPTPSTIQILKCYNRYSFCGLLPIPSSYIIGIEAFDPRRGLTHRSLAGEKVLEGGRARQRAGGKEGRRGKDRDERESDRRGNFGA